MATSVKGARYILVDSTIIKVNYKPFVIVFKQRFGLVIPEQSFNGIYIRNDQYNSGIHEQCFLVLHTSVLIVVLYLVPYDEYVDVYFE